MVRVNRRSQGGRPLALARVGVCITARDFTPMLQVSTVSSRAGDLFLSLEPLTIFVGCNFCGWLGGARDRGSKLFVSGKFFTIFVGRFCGWLGSICGWKRLSCLEGALERVRRVAVESVQDTYTGRKKGSYPRGVFIESAKRVASWSVREHILLLSHCWLDLSEYGSTSGFYIFGKL